MAAPDTLGGMETATSDRPPQRVAAVTPRAARASWTTACGAFLVAAGVTLVLASILHAGVALPLGAATFRDSFPEAAIPEAALGILCLLGAALVLARRAPAYWLASLATGLAIVGAGYGLSATVGGDRPGDVAYPSGSAGAPPLGGSPAPPR